MSPTINTDTATDPSRTGGPKTEAGKARSSQNSLKHGLFAAHDAIREGEHEEYNQARAALIEQLAPEGLLEEAFVAEIMSATWRLRRCRLHEESFVNYIRAGLLQDDYLTPAPQQTVDRARAHANNVLRRSIAELRKLQTERAIRAQIDAHDLPALADSRQVTKTARSGLIPTQSVAQADAVVSSSFCKKTEAGSSFRKTAPTQPETEKQTPRNAPCPSEDDLPRPYPHGWTVAA